LTEPSKPKKWQKNATNWRHSGRNVKNVKNEKLQQAKEKQQIGAEPIEESRIGDLPHFMASNHWVQKNPLAEEKTLPEEEQAHLATTEKADLLAGMDPVDPPVTDLEEATAAAAVTAMMRMNGDIK
jgi:hypothetical protein